MPFRKYFCALVLLGFAGSGARALARDELGELRADSSGTVREISGKFGHAELEKLYRSVNSPNFQEALTNYNCGDPVPKLSFAVRLRPSGYATTRAVEIYCSPELSPVGHTRCLMFAVDYLLDKAVAKLDPDPKDETTREPHCDCSKRDGKEEWVTFPGPDEILAPAKVAAKIAARKSEEAEEEKIENLASMHLDQTGVQIQPDAGEHLVTREKSLGKLPPAGMQLLAIDPTFNHWACAIKRAGKESVVLDGVEGAQYDEIPDHQQLVFSADGRHFAYIAKRDGKSLVVMDGKEGKAYAEIEELFHPIFSPDGSHFAYIAGRQAFAFPQMFAVVDGREQATYELVEATLFSPDSKHLAYNADKKWNRGTMIVLDGKDGKAYDQISSTVFSPDGNHLAYVAYNRTNRSRGSMGMNSVVFDGNAGKAYNSISSMQFSPDSQHFVYLARQGSTAVLVRDGIERKYGILNLGPFSPDSQHLGAVARFGTNWLVLIDGKKLEPQMPLPGGEMGFGPVHDLTFSADNRHLVYTSRGAETNWCVIMDGTLIKSYESIAVSPAFTPDSRKLAYVIKRGEKEIPMLGGYEGGSYDRLLTWRKGLADGGRTEGFSFDERGVLHAMAIRGGEIFQLELELARY